jgi:serine/threonine protein kinase
VKIVRRSAFEYAKPFDREYNGICRFEPVSRKHPAVIDILQVGRDDAAGYFYYVMELADGLAAGPETDAEGYTPRTLRADLYERAPLPLSECLVLGRTMADAIGHLHRNGLVHRDVNPSNIIYVDGQPKLADPGCVDSATRTGTLTGTLGYIPREGFGKPSGDLYALGKVLYEAATGQDRRDFPEIDRPAPELSELNQFIMKSCDEELAERYADAGEMDRDLERIERGETPFLGNKRRRPVVAAFGLAALLAVVAWGWLQFGAPVHEKTAAAGAGVAGHLEAIEISKAVHTNYVGKFYFAGNANDSSGRGNHLLSSNITYGIGRDGQSNSAAIFNGNDSWLRMATNHFATIEDFAILFWVKFSSFRNAPNEWNTLIGGEVSLMVDKSRIVLFGDDYAAQGQTVSVFFDFRTNTWYKVELTRIGKNYSIAVDDKVINNGWDESSEVPENIGLGTGYFGFFGVGNTGYTLHGAIDEITISTKTAEPKRE